MTVSRMSALPLSPYRSRVETSNKLIFISCEGSVTEWEYFNKIINTVFLNVKSKVRVINVLEDVLRKRAKNRTPEEQKQATSADPKSLLNKMNTYREQHKDELDFEHHHEDEFWLIMDIDEHTSGTIVDENGKSNLQKWNKVLEACKEKGYKYAVSNPFFELWLLLHHDDANTNANDPNNDSRWAVTAAHPYEKTDHFRIRLSSLGANLKDKKHINPSHYSKEKVNMAISRAKALDTPPCDYPTDLGTTVYKLLESIAEIDAQYENKSN